MDTQVRGFKKCSHECHYLKSGPTMSYHKMAGKIEKAYLHFCSIYIHL